MRRARAPLPYVPDQVTEEMMRNHPPSFPSVGHMRAYRDRIAGMAHRCWPATYQEDAEYLATWNRLRALGPLGKWEAPEAADTPAEPPERLARPGVLDNLGDEWEDEDS